MEIVKKLIGGQLSLKKGDRFGKLTVESHNKSKKLWHCKCECGNENDVSVFHLKSGKVKSCGCSHKGPQFHIRRPQNESLKLEILSVYKYCAKRSERAFKLSKSQFFKLIESDCHYCGCKPNNTNKKFLKYDENFRYNGIDRKDNTKGYTNTNVVTCCEICNRAKLKMTEQQFITWIKNVYERQTKQT